MKKTTWWVLMIPCGVASSEHCYNHAYSLHWVLSSQIQDKLPYLRHCISSGAYTLNRHKLWTSRESTCGARDAPSTPNLSSLTSPSGQVVGVELNKWHSNPAGQGLHFACPDSEVYCPGGHARGLMLPGGQCHPAGHRPPDSPSVGRGFSDPFKQ